MIIDITGDTSERDLLSFIQVFWLFQFFGMLFSAAGCLILGVPVYLIFESFKIRSKYAYLLAGFITALLGAVLFEIADIGYIFGIFGSIAALIFWRIVIKPLSLEEKP